MMSSTGDDILCPVKAWAAIVQWLGPIPGTMRKTPVNKVNITGVPFGITESRFSKKQDGRAAIPRVGWCSFEWSWGEMN